MTRTLCTLDNLSQAECARMRCNTCTRKMCVDARRERWFCVHPSVAFSELRLTERENAFKKTIRMAVRSFGSCRYQLLTGFQANLTRASFHFFWDECNSPRRSTLREKTFQMAARLCRKIDDIKQTQKVNPLISAPNISPMSTLEETIFR